MIAERITAQVIYLEKKEFKKMEIKSKKLEELRATLEIQIAQPKNNALSKNGNIDLDSCGPASVQVLEGEDKTYNLRQKSQQNELRDWIHSQMNEKYDRLREERDESAAFDREVINTNIESCRLAEENKKYRASMRREVCTDNISRALEKKESLVCEMKKKIQDDRHQSAFLQSNPFLCEDTSVTTSAIAPHRYRPDHFKGLHKDHLDGIVKGNLDVLAEKKSLQEQQIEEERGWARREQEYLAVMEKEEQLKCEKRSQDVKAQMEEMQSQRTELKGKQVMMKRDKFGEISQGFFQGFGTSCR